MAEKEAVTSDIGVFRTADLLIKQHGEEAPIHAAMRSDAMLEAGDLDRQAVWKRIVGAVVDLLDQEPPDDGEAVH